MVTTSVNSSTSSLSSLSAKTGVGGLVSGMDIDELVESLTAASRQKIVKEKQGIQKLQWKQTAYRSVSTALKEFQNTYLDMLSSTNLRSASTFNTVKASTDSSAVFVSATSSASAGILSIGSISQLATSQTITSSNPVSKEFSGLLAGATADELGLSGKSIRMNLDGRIKIISFDNNFINDAATNGLEAAFQNTLDKSFGVDVIDASIADGQLSLSAPGSTLTLNAIGDDTTTLASLGFTNGQSNKLNTASSLENLVLGSSDFDPGVSSYSFKINSVAFKFDKTDSLSTVLNKINTSDAGVTIAYSSVSDKFTMTAKTSGTGDNIQIEETAGNGGLMTAFGLAGNDSTMIYGQNALLKVNGTDIIRSSNSIEIDGIKIELLKETTEPLNITMKEDASSLTDTIKKFVTDYNTTIDLMNKLTKEKVYSDYQPLSDQQRDEMSESEIKSWEEKAKSGILRGDGILRSLASKFQTAIIDTSINGISLYDLGITSAGYSENGKLKIDEEKLKNALETKSGEIRELFTSADGLGNKLNDRINSAIKTSGTQGSRGTLVEMAGMASTRSDTENNIVEKIERSNKTITALQFRLSNEETRYWKQFTAMETALQQLNAQSSILSQFSAQ